MTNIQNNFRLQLCLLCIFYFLLHLPFLYQGYGVEEDSWGLVVNAKEMFDSNSYSASRLPGHPVHEYLLLLLYPFTPLKYNIVSAICASIAVFISAILFKKLNVAKPLLAALALGFCPIFFVAGTYTIDYTLALMLLMLSWYLLADGKNYWAAFVLSLSVGARITNISMLLPMLFFIGIKKENAIKLFSFSAFLGLLSLLIYAPAINKYGIGFFDYTDQFPYPNFPKFIFKATLGVFGLVGFCALFFIFFKRYRTNTNVPIYITLAIVIQILAYIKLPQKSAYLIPVLPFLIIFFSMKLITKIFYLLCFALVISGWILGIQLVNETRGSEAATNYYISIAGQKISFAPLQGNILGDWNKREIKHQYVQKILNQTDTISKPTAIISGWWYNQLIIENESKIKNKNVRFVFYCNHDSLIKMNHAGMFMYYLDEQNIYNDLMFKMKQTNNFAKPM